MKILNCVFLFAILSLALFSCKKDNKDDSSTTTSKPSISFKVDGGATEQTEGAPLGQWFTNGINTLQIVGAITSTEGISFSINNPKIGTLDVIKDGVDMSYGTKTDLGYTNYIATSGTITITAFSSTSVSGTFQFVGSNNLSSPKTKTITEGKFTSDVIKH